MPRITQIVGWFLVVLGAASWAISGFSPWMSLIPAIIGIVLAACGLLAARTGKQKLYIHLALVVALIGIAGTFSNTMRLGTLFTGGGYRPVEVIESAITFVALIVFIVLGIRSFVSARRWKAEAEAEAGA